MLSARRVVVPFLALAALTACRGDRAESPPAAASDEEPAPRLRPPDLSLDRGYTMGRPIVDGRISLVPVFAAAPPALEMMSLSDGMKTGKVTVHETARNENWSVDGVKIYNGTTTPVFAMNGELIIEANQDRSLAENAVIPPGETRVVEVRCVEAHRSMGDSDRFAPLGAIAELSIRRRLRYKDQTEVWAQVNAINARLGLHPPTETYRFAALKQVEGASGTRRDRLVDTLAAVADRDRMVGLAVALDGKVIALDRFATPALYRAVEPRLVASYLPVEDEAPPPGAPHLLTPDDVRYLTHPAARRDVDGNAEFLLPLEDETSRD